MIAPAAVFTSGVPAVTGTDGLFSGRSPMVSAANNYNFTYIERSWDGSKVVDTSKSSSAGYIYSNSSKGGYYDIGDSLIHYYYVEGNVTLKPTLRVSGETHLILADGATLYADDGIYIKDGATLHIHAQSEDDSKGKIIAKPSSDPGIGGMNNTVAGDLVIHGGYIDAEGGSNAAGIGGGNHDSGIRSVTIYGGEHGDGGSITISGGTVTATGSTVGAAIGGGKDGSAGIISISGGTVNAYHIDQAEGAAIGCGKGGSEGTINISGGEIMACYLNGTPDTINETFGAAIGGSKDSDFKGTITISGGSVSAESCNGAAIGAGCYANLKDDITITGSPVVTVSSSTGGAGIGAGQESVLGSGGEVDATISIDLTEGGKVDAYSSAGAAIGHGQRGSDNGTLALSDRMRVNDAGKNDRVSSCRTGRAVITLCTHENKAVTFDETNHTIICPYCNGYSDSNRHTFEQIGSTDSTCTVCHYRNDLPFCSVTVMQQMTDEDGGIIEGSYQGAAVKTPRDSSFILPECNIEVTGYTFAGYRAVRKSSVQAEDNDSTGEDTDNNTPTFIPLSDTIYQPGDVYTLSEQNVTINDDSWTLTFLPLYAKTVIIEYRDGLTSFPDKAAKGYEYTLISHGTDPAGKEFRAWSINGTEYAEGAVIIPEGDIIATAVYDDVYTVTAEKCSGGTITAAPETAHEGDTISVDVKADNGYKIKSVKGAALSIDSEEDNDKTYTFTMPAANVTITAEFELIEYTVTYEVYDGTNAPDNPAKYTVKDGVITLDDPTDNTDFDGWYDNESFKGDPVTTINNGTYGDITLYAKWSGSWSELQDKIDNAAEGATITLEKSYYATDSDKPLSVGSGKRLTIDLNGKSINAMKKIRVFSVDGGDLTITGNGSITGGSAGNSNGGAFIVQGGGRLTLNGGTVSNCDADNAGGAIAVTSGSFIMNGGTIENNQSLTSHGGGVFVQGANSSFTMNGGSIASNTANSNENKGGGVYVSDSGSFTMTGGAVQDNSAYLGSDIYLNDVGMTISGSPVADSVYVTSPVITVSGNLTDKAYMGLTCSNNSVGNALTSGLNGNGTAANFFSAKNNYTVKQNADGEVCLTAVGEQLEGYSLSLEGDIGVKFYMTLDDSIVNSDSAYMQFELPNGDKPTVYVKDVKDSPAVIDGNTYYVFKCNVAAKEMTAPITAQIKDGDNAGTLYTFTVKDYADYLLKNTNVAEYEKAAPLVMAMLNYGAYAQEYFSYNTEALANEGFSEADKALGVVNVPDTFKYNGTATPPRWCDL